MNHNKTQLGDVTLYTGDCLEVMKGMDDKSVDAVITDPPYGITACKWDSIIPLGPMWEQSKRVIKPDGAIVMMASQPFTTVLIASNMKMFRYEWIWEKHRGTNPLLARKQPMKIHESALVFTNGQSRYYPQMTNEKSYKLRGSHNIIRDDTVRGAPHAVGYSKNYDPSKRYPVSIQRFTNHNQKENRLHPTQKPVALMEYLIKTYTNEGEAVLDFTMGSGTTGVACIRTGRKFIGIEIDPKYVEIAKKRIREEIDKTALIDQCETMEIK